MDETHGDPLVNVHRSPNDSVLKTTPETICEYLSFVILSKAMFTLYWVAFSGATTGGYLPCSLNSNGPGRYKSFAHIRVEHRTAAVGQESLVNQPPVLDSVSVCFSPRAALLGTLRNYDGDGKENVKKGIGLIRKTTTLHVHHAFLYISLLSLHNND